VYNQFLNNRPINGVQVGGMAMISVPMNIVFVPMYGATMNSMVMPGMGFNSLPMTGVQ